MGHLTLGSNNTNMFVLVLLFLLQHFSLFGLFSEAEGRQKILSLLLSTDIVNM